MSDPKPREPITRSDPADHDEGQAERRQRTGRPRRRQFPLIRKPLPIERLGSIADVGVPSGYSLESLPRPAASPATRGQRSAPARDRAASRRPSSSRPNGPRGATREPSPDDGASRRRPIRGEADVRPLHEPESRASAPRRARPETDVGTRRPSQRAPLREGAGSSTDGASRRSAAAEQLLDEIVGDGVLDSDWRGGVGPVRQAEPSRGGARTVLFLLAFALIGSGGWLVYDRGLQNLDGGLGIDLPDGWFGGSDERVEVDADPIDRVDERLADIGIEPPDEVAPGSVSTDAEIGPEPPSSTLATRFREELASIEQWVADGDLERARDALASMDRTLYGYGRPEFEALGERIDALAASGSAGAAAESAAREAERQAAVARQAEVDREADERRAAAEQARAAEEARAAEAARAAEQAREAERQGEAQRAAERERQAAADREAQAQAEIDRRIQAEAARQAAAERERADRAAADPNAVATAPIGDADLRTVYSRFLELATAIEARDITTVIDLTQPSGARIQQLLQVFENTQAVYTRIGSMATRQAEGVIVGNLIIDRLVRTDGTIAQAPGDLASIRLTSTRTSDGWSPIEW